VPSFDLYLTRSAPAVFAVENSSPPAIILGAELMGRADPAEQRFLLARALKLIQGGLVVPSKLGASELDVVVGALGRQHVADYAPVGADVGQIINEERRLQKAISKRTKQEIMPFCYELTGEYRGGNVMQRAVLSTANRVGLLAAGSISSAISALRRLRGDINLTSGGSLAAVIRSAPEIAELVAFAVSNEHFQLRQKLAVAVG
jgi:hypothetical protein